VHLSKNYEAIQKALEILGLPTHISWYDIKSRYRYLASKKHPDTGGNDEEMAKINAAYELLKKYVENFRFSFSEEEVDKQFPQDFHAKRFRF